MSTKCRQTPPPLLVSVTGYFSLPFVTSLTRMMMASFFCAAASRKRKADADIVVLPEQLPPLPDLYSSSDDEPLMDDRHRAVVDDLPVGAAAAAGIPYHPADDAPIYGEPSIEQIDAALEAGVSRPQQGECEIVIHPDLPAFAGHCSTSLRICRDLLNVGMVCNVANSTQEMYFKVFQQHLKQPHKFPSFWRAKRLVERAAAHKPIVRQPEYPACPNDCWVSSDEMRTWTPQELEAATCPVCQARIANDRKRVKVRY